MINHKFISFFAIQIYDLLFIFICIFHLPRVYYELKMWPAPSWLHSSVGRALHRYRRCHGFQSRSDLNFFLDYGSNCVRNFKWASRFPLVRFWNYSYNYSLNCIFITNKCLADCLRGLKQWFVSTEHRCWSNSLFSYSWPAGMCEHLRGTSRLLGIARLWNYGGLQVRLGQIWRWV